MQLLKQRQEETGDPKFNICQNFINLIKKKFPSLDDFIAKPKEHV